MIPWPVVLIGFREKLENINPPELLDYIFRLEWLYRVRESIDNSILEKAIISGVLAGLYYGFVNKYGFIEGPNVMKNYIIQYIESVNDGKLKKDSIFTVDCLRGYIATISDSDSSEVLQDNNNRIGI